MKISFLTAIPLLTQRFRSWVRRLKRSRSKTGPHTTPAAQALSEGRRNLHQVFRSFNNELGSIDRFAQTLLEKCETLLSLATGKTEGVGLFQESMQVLDQPIAHVDRSLQSLKPMLEHIDRCDHHSAELLKCQLSMGSVLSPLRHMIVFFRIEAAQLDPEHQTTFLTVADEIHRLRELIDKTFDENVARLKEARRTIAQVRDKVKREYTIHSKRITEKRAEIERVIESLDQQLSRDANRDIHVRDVTSALNREIGRMVSALQFEDILSQRIELVLKSITEGPPADAHNAWMHLMHRQIMEVVCSYAEARNDLEEGTVNILKHANDLSEAVISLRSLDNSTASIDGMVQLLLEAFHEITEISAENVALADHAYESLQPVSEVTENLSSVVIEVSLNIQLIALNAQVRSVQLGDGSGLEVLSARTAEISAELAQLGDRTANEIIELRSVTQGLLSQLDDMRTSGRVHVQDLRTKGSTVVERLHHLRDRTLSSLQEVCIQMESVRELTTPKEARLAELAQTEQLLRQSADWFEELTSDAPISNRERQQLSELISGYTMAAQRRAHADITGVEADLGEHEEETTFFVDLPDEPSPSFEETPPPQTERKSSVPPSAPPPAPVPVAALSGANIELF